MTTPSAPTHLDPSALGTKQYWDAAYNLELRNHTENPSDEGTIWFADSGAEEKILSYLEELKLDNEDEENIDNEDLRVMDLGTGNGHLLFALRDEGWKAKMVGVDYSEASVDLARRIGRARREEREQDQEQKVEDGDQVEGDGAAGRAADDARERREEEEVTFEHFDILNSQPGSWLASGFDIVLDKGTFDAISLSDEVNAQGKKVFETYGSKVEPLMKIGGFLVITSCNWTEEELMKWFESPRLAYHDTIRFPSFTFGGAKGQTVSSVCFRRIEGEQEANGNAS